jgi:2-polyprenyl-3-methyl-5-hydroxy-6-metoxy-1,4-benzoquinol methylase
VQTALLLEPTAIRDIAPVDAFVSLIVLQHNPPPIQYFILNEVLGKIKPDGIAFFQTATYNPAYYYSIDAHMGLNDVQFDSWSMHCLPMRYIMQLFKAHNFDVLEVIEDGLTGGLQNKFHSHSFLAQKR